MNRLQRGIEHISTRLSETASAPVAFTSRVYSTVRNGVQYEIDISKAWQGRTAFRIEDGENSRLQWSDRDYLIPVSLLSVNGVPIEPKRGDRITETFAEPTGSQIFEVSAPEAEQIYRYSDMGNTILRIHTKRVR